MALVNHAKKEIIAKIVYYGPERVGKDTSLRYVYDRIKPHLRGQLKAVPVGGSSLRVFDFSPFEHPIFGDYRIRFNLYTLHGRVANLAAWKMTLKGADGLVIVADASPESFLAGRQSMVRLREILGSYGVCFDDIPAVLQLNKTETFDQVVSEVAVREMGLRECRVFPASALDGEGVLETLTALSRLVIGRIAERDDVPRGCTVVAGAEMTEVTPADIPVANVARDNDEDVWKASQDYRRHQTVSTAVSASVSAGQVVVAEEGVRVEGGRVLIPLEVSTADGLRQQLIVTVMVATG
jgi:signal recognition particle receptor subunit beta